MLRLQAARTRSAGKNGDDLLAFIAKTNPWAQIDAGKSRERSDSDEMDEIPVVRPDGDVELQDAGRGFRVPPCDSCGGILKPNVVFFGDGIPKERAARCAPETMICSPLNPKF